MLNLRYQPLVCLLCLLAVLPAAVGQDRRTVQRRQFQEQRESQLKALEFKLRQLSDQLHSQGHKDAAVDVTKLALRMADWRSGATPPRFVALPISVNLPAVERQWRLQSKTAREEAAQQLYILARKALRNRFLTLAYEIVQDVLRVQPDHKLSRGVIGQQLFIDPAQRDDSTYAGEWVSPYEIRKRNGRQPQVNHPEFGWIPVGHQERYEQGLRPWRSSWISKEKEQELRRNFANAWEIESEHFLIKTNTSFEEGVALSRMLEVYYDWLHSNFAAFFDTPAELQRRFDSVQKSSRTFQRMKVHMFAERAEYDRATRGKVPPGLVTNGLYWEDDETCYLSRGDRPDLDVAFHEATHQILDLASRKDRNNAARKLKLQKRLRTTPPWVMAQDSNFWILEGIACYVESFRIGEGSVSSGDPRHIRFRGAQQRLLVNNFYVDLRTLSNMGKDNFRRHPNIAQLYTQGSGVVHFLMHYKDGIYRDALIQLLHDIYRPNLQQLNKSPSLEELTGVTFDELDLQYREHITNLAAEVGANPQKEMPQHAGL